MNNTPTISKNLLLAAIATVCILLFPLTNKAQISVGNDTSICVPNCATLNATVTNINGATSYTYSAITYNPDPFNAGTSCGINADDGYSSVLPIGFTFCFYGNSYTQFLGSSNGVLSFNTGLANGYCQWPISAAIPSTSDPENCVMGIWQDMYPPDGGTIKYKVYGVAPFRRLVYAYNSEPYYSCWNADLYTGEVILYETTNVIEIHVQSKPKCVGWNGGYGIEGIQNANGTLATAVPGRNYPSSYILTNDAVRFTPSGVQAYTVNWYTVIGNTLVGTGNTVTVCPTTTTSYYAQVVYSCSNATFTDTVTVTVNNPTATANMLTATSCNNPNAGSADVTVVGNGPFTYSWSTNPLQTTDTATNLAVGTYTVTVTTLSGCTATATVTITGPTATTATITAQTNVGCNGGSNGTATVTGGGISPFTYSWSTIPVQTTQTANNLSAGTYTVTVTAANGCTATATVTITEPTPVSVSITAQTNVSCNGGANGTATATGAGGTPNYTYMWSNGQNTQIASGLAIGTFTVTVTDANGCTATTTVTITQPTILTSSISNPVNVTCNNGNNGSATGNGAGGTPGYNYAWSNGQNTQTATNLIAGTYTVTVTDANGCTSTSTITITQPTTLVSNITAQVNVSCNGGNDGSATVTTTGGTGQITFSWNTNPVQTTQTATGLTAGTYTVTSTDANGCVITASVTITEPPLLTATISAFTNATCNPVGTITVTTTGGTGNMFYSWNTNPAQFTQTATGLGAGTYTVTVTDANGCTATAQQTITAPAGMNSTITAHVNILCNGASTGSATVTTTGGNGIYTYLWSNGQNTQTATNLAAGTFWVTTTDGNGCQSIISVTITQPNPLVNNFTNQVNILCNGGNNGSVTANGAGGNPGYTYAWSNGQNVQTATNLIAGNYIVTVTDANGCTYIDNVTITQPTVLTISISTQTNILCNGGNNGSATITASGGTGNISASWNTIPVQTNYTATNLTAGTYTCTVTDANGCVAQTTVTITEPPLLTSAITASTNILCNGAATGSATVTANGGTGNYTYFWNTNPNQNTATATNVVAGTYSVWVTDANGCTSSSTVTLTEPTAVVANMVNFTDITCFGGNNGTATVTANGGTGAITFSWNTNPVQTTATATNLIAGMYTVTCTDANGCTATAQVSISQPPSMTVTTSGDASVCQGQTTTLFVTASGGLSPYSYNWNPGGNGSSSYNPSPNVTTSYTVTITDANGCTVVSPAMTITVNALPTVLFTGTNLAGCDPLTASFIDQSTSTSGTIASWIWDFGNGNSSLSQNPTFTFNAGSYDVTLTVTTSFGCTSTLTINDFVNVYAVPVADFTADPWRTTVLTPQISFHDKSTNATTWYWNFGDHQNSTGTSTLENPFYTYSDPGIYTVTLWVTDGIGCNDSISKTIIIDPDFEFFIPNAFSPNNDGIDEIFSGKGDNVYSYEMRIFNRWGENIFTTTDLNNGWNGKLYGTGTDVKQDTYIYSIHITDIYGNQHNYDGKVSLIR